jgi:hypothetical protein
VPADCAARTGLLHSRACTPSICLVEDSVTLRDRLAELLGSIAGIQIVGFSDTEQDAIS